MMVGDRYYSDADLMRMQRDAEERVREMRNRARQTADAGGDGGSFMPAFANPNRNWDSNPNTQRNRGRINNRSRTSARQNARQGTSTQEEAGRERAPDTGRGEDARVQPPYSGAETPRADAASTGGTVSADTPPAGAPPAGGEKGTTIVEDVVGALGLETDTLLIIGLILILVNQKADTTLILALAYLLI